MNMDSSTGTVNVENAPIRFISAKMKTLQVPDTQSINNNVMNCPFYKDGKLHFLEPKLRAENHPAVAEKTKAFRQFRMRIENTPHLYQQLVEIPSAYLDLIAALVQDSDEPFTILTSRINDVLSPFLRNENMSHKFDVAIEKAINQVAQKVTYGLKQEVYAQIEHTPPNIPWHLNIVRWEANRLDMFPLDMQQIVLCRRVARQNMTDLFSNFIYSLPPDTRAAIVNAKHRRQPLVYKGDALTKNVRPKQTTETDQEREEKLKKKEEEERKKKQYEEEKKQREEEKKQREEEKKQREEEKKQREEEKRKQREEEKRLRDEEKKKREEEKKKKEQSQLRLTSLFTKTTAPLSTSHRSEQKTLEPEKPTLFPSFYIKDYVTISDINQCMYNSIQTYQHFKTAIQSSSTNLSAETFLAEMAPESRRKRGISTHVDIRTLLLPGSSDIMRVPNVRLALRMKLLQFHENVRPAYYGTCTQRSRIVNGRKPFAQDIEKLNYDMDSEAEWEPEGEGEDIHSGDEDDEDPNVDMIDPEDAGWLVPEGYLSDNEGAGDDDGQGRTTGKSHSHNSSKRLNNRKVVLGPFFEGETEEDAALSPFEMQFLMDIPDKGYNPFYKEPTSRALANTSSTNTTNTSNHQAEFTNEHRDALISVINEKPKESIPNLVTEAKSNWLLKDVSKRQLEAKIKNIAIKEKRGSDTKPSWYVKDASSTAE